MNILESASSLTAMRQAHFYPIGAPHQAWGATELHAWRSQQMRHRSYADEVLNVIDSLRSQVDVLHYGDIVYGADAYPLLALRSLQWQADLPHVLITGGVHGYETSGVHGALRFVQEHGATYGQRCNWLVVPCVSPWGYERIHRWNFDAIDPNRSFRDPSPAAEAAALMRLVAPWRGQWLIHIDLHETTDTDETEFRPALAARDGTTYIPCQIPDGFYLVADSERPQLAFQQAILRAVAQITPIAPADAQGQLIGSPVLAQGVIGYPVAQLGLCTSITQAPYTTITEVYPDSPRTTPQTCLIAQTTAVCAALDEVLNV
jgi:hypothetical protein